jgi:hypothetical protein
MNEVIAPIYYCFAHDPHPVFKGYAEEDAFYAFTGIMAEIRDGFNQTVDHSTSGIAGYMNQISELLETHDP